MVSSYHLGHHLPYLLIFFWQCGIHAYFVIVAQRICEVELSGCSKLGVDSSEGERNHIITKNFAKAVWNVLKEYNKKLKVTESHIHSICVVSWVEWVPIIESLPLCHLLINLRQYSFLVLVPFLSSSIFISYCPKRNPTH